MPDKSTLAGRVLEGLRDLLAGQAVLKIAWVAGLIMSGLLSALAKMLGDLTVLQRGMLWGASAMTLLASAALFLFWLVLYLQRRAEESEITDLVAGVRHLVKETGWIYGNIIPPGTTPSVIAAHTRDVRGALIRLVALLVRASKFKQRVQLFEAVSDLEEEIFQVADPDWLDIEPHVRRLEEWANFADRKLLLKSLPSKNPLEQPLF